MRLLLLTESCTQEPAKEGIMPRHRTDFAVQQEQTPNDLHQEETLYTVGEVAKRLRVDTTTVRRWISIGVLDAVILPHRGKRQAYRTRERTLDKLLQPSSPSGSSTESSIRLCLP